jgi:hypothetical protein
MKTSWDRVFRAGALAGAALSLSFLVARPAAAKCPNEAPDDPACEPISSLMMPSVAAVAYFPRGGLDPYAGLGVEFTTFSWSNNNDSFGPSQGTLRLGVAYLRPNEHREMLYYRFGWAVSFEGNASRRFLIPYWGGGLGALWETELGNRALAEASLGMYIFYGRNIVVDASGTAVLPFTAVDKLLAPKAQLTAAFSLW